MAMNAMMRTAAPSRVLQYRDPATGRVCCKTTDARLLCSKCKVRHNKTTTTTRTMRATSTGEVEVDRETAEAAAAAVTGYDVEELAGLTTGELVELWREADRKGGAVPGSSLVNRSDDASFAPPDVYGLAKVEERALAAEPVTDYSLRGLPRLAAAAAEDYEPPNPWARPAAAGGAL
jgi:hypothetical protein